MRCITRRLFAQATLPGLRARSMLDSQGAIAWLGDQGPAHSGAAPKHQAM